ncbi:hypothetical protein [Polynucleobacter sp. JS-Polo-80-F4]|uniref:hypothetical protein n=1 Tax=Polynucleobacter sp. JS-Polo-80-F4 TaxID=2576918 RepID=UPI001C0D0777|nr:hypothetical protein [Polynucleobacter sp. JS-Polo-80-F4]MBU3615861.1 hypothetical protein [Polynucleobacter sp. JS-Polo-80-F4]
MFKEKSIIFGRRLSESFPACLFVMVKGDLSVLTLGHWEIALRTGLLTASVMVALSFFESRKWLHNRYTTGALTGLATVAADYITHTASFTGEALVTGVAAAILCVLYSFVVKE